MSGMRRVHRWDHGGNRVLVHVLISTQSPWFINCLHRFCWEYSEVWPHYFTFNIAESKYGLYFNYKGLKQLVACKCYNEKSPVRLQLPTFAACLFTVMCWLQTLWMLKYKCEIRNNDVQRDKDAMLPAKINLKDSYWLCFHTFYD